MVGRARGGHALAHPRETGRFGGITALLIVAALSTRAAADGHRVGGHVSSDYFCSWNASAVAVVLTPTGRIAMTDADGVFAFDGVGDGDYVLTFDAGDALPLTVGGRDESVQFCLGCPKAIRMEPRHGPAGSIATAVGGGCYALHSGAYGQITFDGVAVGFGGGSQIGDFRSHILVPRDAVPGPHTVVLLSGGGRLTIASDQFIVDPGPPPCAGDCDGDGTVTVSELLRGIGRVLRRFEDATCAAYPDQVTVDMVIDAVADALASCGPATVAN